MGREGGSSRERTVSSLYCPAVRDGRRGCAEGRPRAQDADMQCLGVPPHSGGPGGGRAVTPTRAALQGPGRRDQPATHGSRLHTVLDGQAQCWKRLPAQGVGTGPGGDLGGLGETWPLPGSMKATRGMGASRGWGADAGPDHTGFSAGNTVRLLPSALYPHGGVTQSLTFSSDAPGHAVCPQQTLTFVFKPFCSPWGRGPTSS